MNNNFCKIYVSGICNHARLNQVINETCSFFTMANDFFYIDLNEEYTIENEIQFPDGFLYFKYIVDIDFKDNIEENKCVDVINFVLKKIWNDGIPAVASCDFEQSLINNGGYKSTNTPWFN